MSSLWSRWDKLATWPLLAEVQPTWSSVTGLRSTDSVDAPPPVAQGGRRILGGRRYSRHGHRSLEETHSGASVSLTPWMLHYQLPRVVNHHWAVDVALGTCLECVCGLRRLETHPRTVFTERLSRLPFSDGFIVEVVDTRCCDTQERWSCSMAIKCLGEGRSFLMSDRDAWRCPSTVELFLGSLVFSLAHVWLAKNRGQSGLLVRFLFERARGLVSLTRCAHLDGLWSRWRSL